MLKHEEVKEKTLVTISEILSQFNLRLVEIESQLTSLQGKDVVLDEKRIPEKIGELGGKTVSKIGEGVQKLIKLPFCDCCRTQLKDEFALCECGRKICLKNCAIMYEGVVFCPICMREKLPISKKTFKVLWAINYNITSPGRIKKLSKMRKDEIQKGFAELFQSGYVIKDGFWKSIRITDDGIIAVEQCYKVFSKDVDCVYYEQALRSSVS